MTAEELEASALSAPQPKNAPIHRDLDGWVHIASGFIARADYERVLSDHPELGLPVWADLPLSSRPPSGS